MIDLNRREQFAWGSAILLFALGDVATTATGLQLGAVEQSPVGAATISTAGLLGLVAHKLAAMAMFASLFLLWRRFGRQVALGVPIGLALLGVGVTAWNAAVIGALVA